MMGGSKQKKKNKQKRKISIEEEQPNKKKRNNIRGAAPNPPQQQPSLASRLKKVRGTADLTPLPPKWSSHTSKSFLSPFGGSLFDSCKRECYRAFCWEDPDKLPPTLHVQFDQAFDALYEAGLFLHDAVQPGGKRLTRTFVSRTVIGNPGSTYRYLGLRLFSHPWSTSGENDSTTTDEI
jgi:alpha-ketoglutarate-dependent dioxygenase FTO